MHLTLRTFTFAAFALFCCVPLRAADDAPAVAAPAASDEGFVPLFDGKTFAGWRARGDAYVIKDEAIVCNPSGGGGNLYTEKEYGDFHFKFEFMLTPGANNGIGIRAPLSGDAAYVGMEIQVLDDGHKKYAGIQPYQAHGSVYGVAAAKRGHLKPTGEWNSEEIICRGHQVTVILNGVTIVDVDTEKASTPKTIDGKNHPGLKRTAGHICFCGHGDVVSFRNLRIKEFATAGGNEPKKE